MGRERGIRLAYKGSGRRWVRGSAGCRHRHHSHLYPIQLPWAPACDELGAETQLLLRNAEWGWASLSSQGPGFRKSMEPSDVVSVLWLVVDAGL